MFNKVILATLSVLVAANAQTTSGTIRTCVTTYTPNFCAGPGQACQTSTYYSYTAFPTVSVTSTITSIVTKTIEAPFKATVTSTTVVYPYATCKTLANGGTTAFTFTSAKYTTQISTVTATIVPTVTTTVTRDYPASKVAGEL